jgi:glycosyltransferase involved in cell wall biosynthesis
MPKYTIIMPAKNAEHTIQMAIKSTLLAFPKDTQVEVWDDGSHDKTAEMAVSVDRNRVAVTRSEHSVGSGMARQKLLQATDSEFIVVQDADDISLPWRFIAQSGFISKSDFAFATSQRFTKGATIYRPSLPFNYTSTDVAISLLFHNPLAHSTMIAKRSALMDIGGYCDSRVAQDYEMLLRAAQTRKVIRRLGVPTVLYRVSSSQVSNQQSYGAKILADTTILTSYGRLLETMLPHNNFGLPARIALPELKATVSSYQVQSLIHRLSSHLKPYYQRLYSRRRLGYIAAEALG